MHKERKTAIVAGVLFLTAWLTGAGGQAISRPVLTAPDYFLELSVNTNQAAAGILLEFMMAAACAGIAISMYPLLRKFSPGLALGAVGFRTLEAAVYMVGVGDLLSLLALSQQPAASAAGAAQLRPMGDLLLAQHEQGNVVGMFAFAIGALMYYVVLYRSRLIPRWLSGWGLAGAIMAILATVLVMLRLINPFSTLQVITYLPIGLQEIALGTWLIVKGFDSTVLIPPATQLATDTNRFYTAQQEGNLQ